MTTSSQIAANSSALPPTTQTLTTSSQTANSSAQPQTTQTMTTSSQTANSSALPPTNQTMTTSSNTGFSIVVFSVQIRASSDTPEQAIFNMASQIVEQVFKKQNSDNSSFHIQNIKKKQRVNQIP
ncbi:uncharacterized protein LOC143512750 [Brachyhypopomus gauderio]|uniref:uncharacterized protein LOC143512750 n=1 Tax=Brachyhypopomus gauderio TaxID=698409 RepID=UPI004042D06E